MNVLINLCDFLLVPALIVYGFLLILFVNPPMYVWVAWAVFAALHIVRWFAGIIWRLNEMEKDGER